ncbi:pentatricopeptide repeat protein [Teratosphaeria destructans]|uniref:Pentatricopeptide repeat protein n=1 Tax=Teratosphaeria destructans TaxID=418781 RepID=A0A9W7W6X0_9PEZI|nr:pentatricopeptide repeat protein [Teratosphaeria destructans]
MPYVKPSVHLSRLAGSALKSFTHGYAQTVVAASQSSFAAQNTTTESLRDTLAGRIRAAERHKLQNALGLAENTRQASTSAVPSASGSARPETSHHHKDAPGLEKYLDAWEKQQRQGATWQQFPFAKRIEWQPPTTVPVKSHQAVKDVVDASAGLQEEDAGLVAPSLKRSYTTSALDNFGKTFGGDVAAEAAALQQVNDAIAEEIQKSKEESDDILSIKASSEEVSTASDERSSTSPTSVTPTHSFSSTSEADVYTQEISHLAENGEYERVPAAFGAMLRAGVQKPSAAAYRALLTSAIKITHGKHLKAPKALEVYSDMLRRKVTPDSQTFDILIELLAKRASECMALKKDLEQRLARYGGLEKPGRFMFSSSESELGMIVEDSSLVIAMRLFDRASQVGIDSLSPEACAALVIACAEQGRLADMAKVYQHMENSKADAQPSIFPAMIAAFGTEGDLRSAVEVYDRYKELAVANNAGENRIVRIDNEVYGALVKAYGSAHRLKGGLKFLSNIQADVANDEDLAELRKVVALTALLPLALKDDTLGNAMELTRSLTGPAYIDAMAVISITAADRNLLDIAVKAFNSLAATTMDLTRPAMAMLAMHIRNANLEAAEPFFRIIENAPAKLSFVEPTTMRAVALIGIGQATRGLRQTRRMFARLRDQTPESNMAEAVGQVDEALELIGNFMLNSQIKLPEASAELLRMMTENGGLIAPIAEHLMARLGPEEIASLSPADLELLMRIQAGLILNESHTDIAGPARFGCLLNNITSRSIMPSAETETSIERALVNLDRNDLSLLWNNYRYPPAPAVLTPAFTPIIPYQQPQVAASGLDDGFDPYAPRIDVKGSNVINDLLERPQGRRTKDAFAKFRNMRRVGRVPRMFTYGKLIEAAARENDLDLAHHVLELAKQDVPFDGRYRVVRFGWQQILDHMVAGCLLVGRRDLAAKFHQDLMDMGTAPSANTFGLYITTLKESTKTFDEASEAVKIFLRAKAEGVEPSSFLYNALIGKLGKARRIDDCLFYFAEMRNLGIRPTSVTYGTIVNALCRVSDEKFAEEIFEEMETCTNYKPRPAPYHSLMQFFLATKRDRSKVLAYYERMRSKGIEPTVHTFKLLIDTYATLEPINMSAAEAVLEEMRSAGIQPEAVHYASLIHAKGCVLHDMADARALFDVVVSQGQVRLQPNIYQALFESMNANHAVADSESLVADMQRRGVEFTPYIANALIHGWTLEKNIQKALQAFQRVPLSKREPSTYETMVRAYLANEDRESAKSVVREALSRGYPPAVAGKIAELVR